MKTAEEMRNLMPVTVEQKVADLLVAAETMAKQGYNSLRTGWDYGEDKDLWIMGGYNKTPEWFEAKSILEKLGYTVEFYDRNENLAANMYTLIKW